MTARERTRAQRAQSARLIHRKSSFAARAHSPRESLRRNGGRAAKPRRIEVVVLEDQIDWPRVATSPERTGAAGELFLPERQHRATCVWSSNQNKNAPGVSDPGRWQKPNATPGRQGSCL